MGLPSPLIAMNALWRSFLGRNYSPATDNTAYDTKSLPPLPIVSGGTGADSAIKAVPNLFPNLLTDTKVAYEIMARLAADGKPGRVTVADLKQILGVINGYNKEDIDSKLGQLEDKIVQAAASSNFSINDQEVLKQASGTWVSPITGLVKVTMIGGGGGGGGGFYFNSSAMFAASGGGGGSGGLVIDFIEVTAGQSISFRVGVGGSAGSGSGSNGSNGTGGTDSTFLNLVASGGGGGGKAASQTVAGIGGTSSVLAGVGAPGIDVVNVMNGPGGGGAGGLIFTYLGTGIGYGGRGGHAARSSAGGSSSDAIGQPGNKGLIILNYSRGN